MISLFKHHDKEVAFKEWQNYQGEPFIRVSLIIKNLSQLGVRKSPIVALGWKMGHFCNNWDHKMKVISRYLKWIVRLRDMHFNRDHSFELCRNIQERKRKESLCGLKVKDMSYSSVFFLESLFMCSWFFFFLYPYNKIIFGPIISLAIHADLMFPVSTSEKERKNITKISKLLCF